MWDWNEYLRLAEKLATPQASQAELRCATSRAYYAALHAALSLLEENNQNIRTQSRLHETVHNLLKGKGFNAWVSVRFDTIKRNRILANYHLDDDIEWSIVASRTIFFQIVLSLSPQEPTSEQKKIISEKVEPWFKNKKNFNKAAKAWNALGLAPSVSLKG